MITTTFSNVYDTDGITVISKRLNYYFNGVLCTSTEFPANSEMDAAAQDAYVASRLGMLFS